MKQLDEAKREAIRVLSAEGLSEDEMARQLGISRRQVRNAMGRSSEFADGDHLTWSSEGVRANELPDEDEVYQRALAQYQKARALADRKWRQSIVWNAPAVALVFVGDQHLGDPGTDLPRCFREAELVRDTPGMYAWLMGDLLNNFVIGKLRQARDNVSLGICDEWALVRRYLRIIGPKIVGVTGGNHDHWSALLTGVDYFREVLASIAPNVLYDSDDSRVALTVGGKEAGHTFKLRARHKWRGSSMWNVTHGQERAARWDDDADILVGAHTHAAGVARGFTVGGRSKVALQCGSYKAHDIDSWSRQNGFPMPNSTAAVTTVLTERGEMTGFESLDLAADVIEGLLK